LRDWRNLGFNRDQHDSRYVGLVLFEQFTHRHDTSARIFVLQQVPDKARSAKNAFVIDEADGFQKVHGGGCLVFDSEAFCFQ
jgi:hypothetical protein